MILPAGKGMFIWTAYELGDPAQVVGRARDAGLGHLCVKFADGRADHAVDERGRALPSYHPAIRSLVPVAHRAGLQVWGWPYIYGNDPAGEAKAQAGWFRDLGFDGFVIDAEGEYKNRKTDAEKYCRTLRAELPDATIALSSYWYPPYHPEFPWATFDAICDLHMPQVYWWSRDPVECLRKSVGEFEKYGKPVVPTGGDLDDPGLTVAEIKAFAAEAKRLGCPAINWWHWQGCSGAEWTAIAQAWEATASPPPPAVTVGPTGTDVADIARAACDGHAAGWKSYTAQGEVFDLREPRWCGRFVRQCYVAAARRYQPSFSSYGFPWLAQYALDACRELAAGGGGPGKHPFGYYYGPTGRPRPGDIVGMNPSGTRPGHIGIYMGDGMLAENTSARRGVCGPGTTLTPIKQATRVTGFYRVYPPSDVPELAVVSPEGMVVPCHPEIDAGVTRGDVKPVAKALGYEAHYREWEDGRKRVYLKRPEGSA